MKVLMISEYFPPKSKGGGEISAFLLAKHLAKDVEVHVLTSHFKGLKKKESMEGVVVHRLLETGENPSKIGDNLKRSLSFKKSLFRELPEIQKKEQFDIIHCMNTDSVVAVELKKKINANFVMHVNGPVPFCPKGTLMYKDKEICTRECSRLTYLDCYLHSKRFGKTEFGPFVKYNPFTITLMRKRYENFQTLLGKFDYYMPISTYMKKRLLLSGVKKDKISVVYNITELENFFKLKTKKHKKLKLLYLGEYSKPKGAHIFLQALKRIDFDYEANFYGEGILKDKLRKESKKYKLNVKVNEKVDYSKIPKILEKHDVLVFPSFVGEAFGRAVLEGCAAGKTVIASQVGGVPDIIENRKNGYLFSPGSSDELVKLLRKTNEQLLDPKKVRKSIKKKFSNKKTISDVKTIYKELMSK